MAKHGIFHIEIRMYIVEIDPLKSVIVAGMNGEAVSMRYMLDSWSAHVNRLCKEAGHSLAELSTAWGPFDFHASLIIRDCIERALSSLHPEHRDLAIMALNEIDATFIQITQNDEHAVLLEFLTLSGVDYEASGWWWERIPSSGPVVEELERALSHSNNGNT